MNTPTIVALLVFAPLFGWRIYRRFRRLIGRQRLSKKQIAMTLIIYPLVTCWLCLSSFEHPLNILWLVAGIACGIGLGIIGLKKTQFEPTPDGLFYTPHAHLGIALSLLFIGRIAYRSIAVSYMMSADARALAEGHQYNNFQRSPLTLALYGLLAGYYVTYAIGLLLWRNGVIQAERRRAALQAQQAPASALPPVVTRGGSQ